MKILIDSIDAFVFDFDGVMTNNLVHLDESGKEWVSCSRADGLMSCVSCKNQPIFFQQKKIQ